MRWAGQAPADGAKGLGPIFMTINRNKRSVLLDLRDPEAANALKALVKTSEIFATTVRYEGLKRLGLDYDSIRALRPDVVYVHGAGYGSAGPYAGDPAYDDMIQTASGLADLLTRTDGDPEPRLLPSLLADKVSGLFMGQAILAALFHWQRTGQGQFVEVPMLECVTSFNLVEHLFGHVFDPPTGQWTYPRVTTPHRKPHPTKDGYIGLLPYSGQQWEQFFQLAGWGEAITKDPRFIDDMARTENSQALYALLDAVTVTRTTKEWLEVLRPLGIPVAPLNRMDQLMDDPHLKAVGMFERREHPDAGRYWSVRPPMTFSETPANVRRHPPKLGEHTRESWRSLVSRCRRRRRPDMDFQLSEEHHMLKDLVRRFVDNELMPLEASVLRREVEGRGPGLTPDERAKIERVSREMGLWGLDAPEDIGGADLPAVAMVGVNEEMGRTITPFTLPPDSPNLRMLMATVSERQREAYLAPYVRGETVSAIGISEPDAGSDPSAMTNAGGAGRRRLGPQRPENMD